MPRLLSIITPAYNETETLPVFYKELLKVSKNWNFNWEWIIVDDHSKDNTFEIIQHLSQNDSRVRGIRLSRNFGSHHALFCGLTTTNSDCAILMAVDLQDPVEMIGELFKQWNEGSQVVWAARENTNGTNLLSKIPSRIFATLQRNLMGLTNFPEKGADFVLIDQIVINELKILKDVNIDLFSVIFWMGFKSKLVNYIKKERTLGKSGWTYRKKFNHLINSVVLFSGIPLRLMSFVGFVFALGGLIYASVVTVNAFNGVTVPGWASLMIVLLLIGGIIMMMLGILGEYLWRVLQQGRGRPQYLIEAVTHSDRESVSGKILHAKFDRV